VSVYEKRKKEKSSWLNERREIMLQINSGDHSSIGLFLAGISRGFPLFVPVLEAPRFSGT
jgi:hypothetical protein